MENKIFNRKDYHTQKIISCLGRFILLDKNNELRYPDYQRDYVWSEEEKIKLIESIFDYVEIGRIVLHEEFNPEKSVDTWCFEVIDGKQRLGAILDYTKNKYKVREKYYKDLNEIERREFSNILVPVIEVKNLSKINKLDLFISVNTTGVIMSNNHLNQLKNKLKLLKENKK